MGRSSLDQSNLKKLTTGAWVWEEGIGYRTGSNGTGTWYIKYWAPIPGVYPAGARAPSKQVKERLPHCRNRSQAEGVLMARRSAIFEGVYQPRKKADAGTIADFAEKFFQSKRHLRTIAKYRQQVSQYLAPHFGKKPLGAISNQDCLEYYNVRLDSDAAIATVNSEIACLKSLFSEAIRAGRCQHNPVRGIRLLNPNNVRDRMLTDDETARLFTAVSDQNNYVRPLFLLLYHTGMRLGEALALRWQDIEREHGRIVVRDSKSGEGRNVPLRQALADEFIRWRGAGGSGNWLFPGRHDNTVPMNTIRAGWLRLCQRAGVANLRPHDLRHNFTSMLQARGVSDSIIMSITGHKTHVMLHRYSHANDALRRAAVESLPNAAINDAENIVSITRR